jgi:hypothetical protein
MALYDDAYRLGRAILEAGKDPAWMIACLAMYYGEIGQAAALDAIEEEQAPDQQL